MRILYVFPHPDDESFGPALGIARQLRDGHQVHLLTLTRGEATKQRLRLGLSKEEMGRVRLAEMEAMAEALGLSGLRVLDFPDARLKELDPRPLEEAVADEVRRLEPSVVVTYPVHGISGFEDHIVTHAVVKRAYCQLAGEPGTSLRRLAFWGLGESPEPDRHVPLRTTPDTEADCRFLIEATERSTAEQALACYETYLEVIEKARPLERAGDEVRYEFFGERFDPPVSDLTDALPERPRTGLPEEAAGQGGP